MLGGSAVRARRTVVSAKGSQARLWAGSPAKPLFWDFGDWASLRWTAPDRRLNLQSLSKAEVQGEGMTG